MIAENRTWQEICEAAIQESDPVKLRDLITDLMRAFNERDRPAKSIARSDASHPTYTV
jgi:hypothetical protein